MYNLKSLFSFKSRTVSHMNKDQKHNLSSYYNTIAYYVCFKMNEDECNANNISWFHGNRYIWQLNKERTHFSFIQADGLYLHYISLWAT